MENAGLLTPLVGTTPFSDCAGPQKLGQFFTEMEEKRRKQGNGPKGLLFGPLGRENL